jgi:ABC-2 type transport system permease protein
VLPAVAAFLVAQYASVSPNAPVAVVSSFVPFLSPFVMFTRVAVTTVPGWHIALAIAINALVAGVCFFVAGKVYRVGLLLYGRLPSPGQIFAALRT